MKQITYTFAFIVLLLSFVACEDDNQSDIQDIKIGKGEQSLTEVTVNRQTQRDIVLSGGNNKYLVNVADSKIASTKMVQDTLRLKGLLEGETYATIYSLDLKAVLKINVKANDLKFTQSELLLRPKDFNKTISLGGGNIVTLEKNDPDDIFDYRWTSSGVLFITAKYEGEASLIARSKGLEPAELKIKIESQDVKGYLNEIGFYNTLSRTVYRNINPVLVAYRKEMGTVLSSINTPSPNIRPKRILVRPVINPKLGEMIEIDVTANFSLDNFKSGKLKVKVVELREDKHLVVLRGKGYKLVVPYYNS